MKIIIGFFAFLVSAVVSASPVVIDWQASGGSDQFERQTITFTGVQVDSFESLASSGSFLNLVDTTGSLLQAEIYARVGGAWQLLGVNDSIRGGHMSSFGLSEFVFSPVDFTVGLLDAIYVTNSGAGASVYTGMAGTQFVFDDGVVTVPEPAPLVLLLIGVLVVTARRVIRS